MACRSDLRRKTRRGGSVLTCRSLMFEPLEKRRLMAITVTTNLDVVDVNDGLTSLREAVVSANTMSGADTIDFAAALTAGGPTKILLTQGELVVTAALTIDGPGAGLLTIDAQQQSRIFNITATTGNFTIAGLTLTNGRTTGDTPLGSNVFSGGAIRSLTNGLLLLEDTQLTANGTTGIRSIGGAVYAQANLRLSNSIVTDNYTTGGSASGGGIAGVANVALLQSAVSGNRALGSGSSVGGVLASDAIIFESTVSNNIGSGVQATDGAIVVTSSTIGGNSSTGVVAQNQSVTVVDSTVSGNIGGILAKGIVSLIRTTVSGNHAAPAATGAGGAFSSNATVSLTESIVAGNSGGGSPDVDAQGHLIGAVSSLIGDQTGTNLAEAPVGSPDSNGNLIGGPVHGVIDPKFGPLVYNGGPVFADGSRMLTLALRPGSPAINAGPLAVAGMGGVPMFDQRGAPWSRVVGGRIDVGAFESQANPLAGDYSFNGRVDAADYTVWRDTLGATNDLRADGSGAVVGVPDGVVNQLDYNLWKTNFGHVLAGGGALAEPVAAVVSEVAGELRLAGATAEEFGARSSPTMEEAFAGVIGAVAVPGARVAGSQPIYASATRTDALIDWLGARATQQSGDGEVTPSLSDDGTDEASESSAAFDCVFDLLGESLLRIDG